jgi:hypothetical protein
MGRFFVVFSMLVLMATAGTAFAQEPVGCDKFKWPIDKERALLAVAAPVASAGEVAKPLAGAAKLPLVPFAEGKLPTPPARQPKSPDSYAGFVRYAAPPRAATYRVTLSDAAWIDVVQDRQEVKSIDHSGALGCDGIRKSVKFNLTTSPFVIEISGTTARDIAIVVTAD